ncbi:MAG: hypothetical protein L3K02_01160 [Thermoplasmata archaeon]|nr:hypothetical protein [Thermoplasmata archaeon]
MGDRLMRPAPRRRPGVRAAGIALVLTLMLVVGIPGGAAAGAHHGGPGSTRSSLRGISSAVGNFSTAIDRLVELLGVAGSGLLSLVWARVALSWFSNDITKKVQAKDRARDALIGTLLFTAAITGLFWGLAHWVLTGS